MDILEQIRIRQVGELTRERNAALERVAYLEGFLVGSGYELLPNGKVAKIRYCPCGAELTRFETWCQECCDAYDPWNL